MRLIDLIPAVASIKQNAVRDLRTRTYLLTYNTILKFALQPRNDQEHFQLLAALAYGWMPRVVRLEVRLIVAAAQALRSARDAKPKDIQKFPVDRIAECLRSVVGASKVLHFVNPKVFPIWDSKVEGFRLKRKPSHAHMKELASYLAYAKDVQAIQREPGFNIFFKDISRAHSARLRSLGVEHHEITKVRAVEMAAFERAGGKPDE